MDPKILTKMDEFIDALVYEPDLSVMDFTRTFLVEMGQKANPELTGFFQGLADTLAENPLYQEKTRKE